MPADIDDPADVGYWDQTADQRDALPAGWRRHARRAHLDLIEAWIGRPRGVWLKTDLFEERSSHRALLPHLGAATWIGSDLSPQVAAAAQHAGTAQVLACDVRALPIRGGALDGILSTSTLDHFDDPAQIDVALAEFRRVVAADGHLILTLDNARNPLVRLRNALPAPVARRTGLVPFAVGATHDAAGTRDALERTGWKVRSSVHLLHAPHVVGTRLAAWSWYERRVLPRLDRLASTRVAGLSGHFVAVHATPL